MESIRVAPPFIKLDSFLKFCGCCQTGGEAKSLVLEGGAKVNGEKEIRRGRKLYGGDIVSAHGKDFLVVIDDN